jgi:hypothetical protein
LTLRYTGRRHDILRDSHSRGWMDNGEPRCVPSAGSGWTMPSPPCRSVGYFTPRNRSKLR